MEQFHDLKQAVLTISSSSSTARLTTPEILVHMYGIERGRLSEIKRDFTLRRDLIMLAKPFMDWFENEVDAYYCFCGFAGIRDSIMQCTKSMVCLLLCLSSSYLLMPYIGRRLEFFFDAKREHSLQTLVNVGCTA